MADDQDKRRPHAYDGIEEYDNSLPNWWLATFFLTIVFAVYYWYHYQILGTGKSQQAEFEAKVAAHEKLYRNDTAGAATDESLAALVEKTEVVNDGKATFASFCVACHGAMGEGGIGPNLTDKAWIHGSKPTAIRKVVTEGVPAAGMTPWSGILSPQKIDAVVAYVITLKGTNPPNPKAPQGNVE